MRSGGSFTLEVSGSIRRTDWLGARNRFEQVLNENSVASGATNLLAIVQSATGSKENARSILKQAMQAAPTLARTYQNLAKLRASEGQFVEAAESACRALELSPGNADAVIFLEEMYSKLCDAESDADYVISQDRNALLCRINNALVKSAESRAVSVGSGYCAA